MTEMAAETNDEKWTGASAIDDPEMLPRRARDYLTKHRIDESVTSLMNELLRTRPVNPYEYLAGQLLLIGGKPPSFDHIRWCAEISPPPGGDERPPVEVVVRVNGACVTVLERSLPRNPPSTSTDEEERTQNPLPDLSKISEVIAGVSVDDMVECSKRMSATFDLMDPEAKGTRWDLWGLMHTLLLASSRALNLSPSLAASKCFGLPPSEFRDTLCVFDVLHLRGARLCVAIPLWSGSSPSFLRAARIAHAVRSSIAQTLLADKKTAGLVQSGGEVINCPESSGCGGAEAGWQLIRQACEKLRNEEFNWFDSESAVCGGGGIIQNTMVDASEQETSAAEATISEMSNLIEGQDKFVRVVGLPIVSPTDECLPALERLQGDHPWRVYSAGTGIECAGGSFAYTDEAVEEIVEHAKRKKSIWLAGRGEAQNWEAMSPLAMVTASSGSRGVIYPGGQNLAELITALGKSRGSS